MTSFLKIASTSRKLFEPAKRLASWGPKLHPPMLQVSTGYVGGVDPRGLGDSRLCG